MNPRIIDHHVHTHYSPDAKPNATFNRYVERAKELNLPGLMVTDHMDLDSPDPLFQNIINYNNYVKEVDSIKEQTHFNILKGVEVGYQPHLQNELQAFLLKYSFDFIICSMHVCDQLDFYNGDFFKGKNQRQSTTRYFEAVLESVIRYDEYDVYGHLDYIVRYGGYQKPSYEFKEYQEFIDEILKTIVKKGKGIEINTSGFRYQLNVMHPKFDVIRRYKELGGEIITIGSDAHQVEHLYANVDDAIRLLKTAGFDYVTQFSNRKPSFIKL